jgi:hypothetical protein
MTIYDVIEVLEKADRMGTERDTPEGSCYIKISDTLANEMAGALKAHQFIESLKDNRLQNIDDHDTEPK